MSELPENDQELSFLQHLVELRGRLLKSCLTIAIVLLAPPVRGHSIADDGANA